MKLTRALERVPRRFDPARLAAEVARFGERDWIPCATGALGSAAVPLVTAGGSANHDFALAGPARPTAALGRCPYLEEVMGALGVPVARSRLVRLAGATAPNEVEEWNYHWFRRAPVCIPLVTSAAVTLSCGGETAHMAAGEAWIFDSARPHRLHNPSAESCVHLIVETRDPAGLFREQGASLVLEPYRFEVLSEEEVAALTEELLADPGRRPMTDAERLAFVETLEHIRRRWGAAFRRFGHQSTGELAYQDIILDFRERVMPKLAPKSAGMKAAAVIDTMLWMSPPAPRRFHRPTTTKRSTDAELLGCPEFERPLFVVSAPRSGSTLLFDLLSRFPDVWTIGGESHEIIRAIPELHPATRGYSSDRLTGVDASPAVARALREGFARQLVDRRGQRYLDGPTHERPSRLRFLEKTPANALRIPFLHAVFPDALFVHLVRDPRENISSLVEGWRSRRFLSYRAMPGWPYRDWSFLLPPGWSSLEGRSLVEIAAYQWKAANAAIEEDLGALPPSSWRSVSYDELIQRPAEVLLSIGKFAGLRWDEEVEKATSGVLPLSRVTLSAPSPDKWRRHEQELAALLPFLEPTTAKATTHADDLPQ
ncbi:sulfotransferase [Sorangium sp. So ce1151]|uniref:sulfotransferase n=1 Tax=Sorangium sp. So ce1151 TaxID=3133332 RepID=UPI003F6196FE